MNKEQNSVQSSLNSAFKTAGEAGKFLLKKGVDAGLTLALGGSNKILQTGKKVIDVLKLFGKTRKKEDKTWVFVLLGIAVFFVLITIFIIIIPAAFITEILGKLKLPFTASSEYIAVSKVVYPSTIENSQLPYEFSYTITINAVKEDLKNVEFVETFTVYQNGTSKSFNPIKTELDGITQGVNKIGEIKVGEPKIFSYKITLDTTYQDSFVFNDLLVKAVVGGFPKQVKTSAGITIGQPSGCFIFSGPWTSEEKTKESQAIGKLLSFTKYRDTLCKNGSIFLIRENVKDYAHCDSENSRIYITNGSTGKTFESEQLILYTLAHESGHIYLKRNLSIFGKFLVNVLGITTGFGENLLCSYPINLDEECQKLKLSQAACNDLKFSEDFAETIAVFVMNKFYPDHFYSNCNGELDLESRYKEHYTFAKYDIFGQN